jgi:NAD(P)-dependent dehydrogenase (short-subunit alcohol dehydrogenase family)
MLTMKLENSVVFVTGANRGLGRAFAEAALAAGARKVYAGARDPASVDLARVVPVTLDVTNAEQVRAAAERAGDVTLLINNAGILRPTKLLAGEAGIASARAEFETNFFGPWRVAQAFAPALKANGGGAILNVLSVLSWLTMPGFAPYSASKAATWQLSNGLRQELREQGTQVTSLHVGYMDTDMARGYETAKSSPAAIARLTLAGVEAGLAEVLADELTQQVKQGLSAAQPPYVN